LNHRVQITLSDGQYRRLSQRSRESGFSIAELIRRRLDDDPVEQYTLEEKLQAVRDTAGIWANEPDAHETGAEFVERLRRGVDTRLRRKRS
jgi:hypothetical protein